MDPITQTSLHGLTQLQQLGLAGIFLSLLLLFGMAAIWYLARHCEKRTDASLSAFKDEAALNRQVISNNTEAFNGVQVTLARMEGRIGSSPK